MNLTIGGLFGYSSVNSNVSRKVPVKKIIDCIKKYSCKNSSSGSLRSQNSKCRKIFFYSIKTINLFTRK